MCMNGGPGSTVATPVSRSTFELWQVALKPRRFAVLPANCSIVQAPEAPGHKRAWKTKKDPGSISKELAHPLEIGSPASAHLSGGVVQVRHGRHVQSSSGSVRAEAAVYTVSCLNGYRRRRGTGWSGSRQAGGRQRTHRTVLVPTA